MTAPPPPAVAEQHEWNVKVPVVAVVTADGARSAARALEGQIRRAGFQPYADENTADAFHSDTCPCGGRGD